MSKYLELFKGSFDETVSEKQKLENKPYVAYSIADGKLVYTVVPKETPSAPSAPSVIYYTTNDNQLIYTDIDMVYNVINHTYENGVGVIEFDSTIERIQGGAFIFCDNLISITFPEGVTRIETSAVSNCRDHLTSITIPKSVTHIDGGAFWFCPKLNTITFSGTIKQWNEVQKGGNICYDCPATVVHCTDGDVEI